MNCTKNPRLKNRGIAEAASRALEINLEHMAIILRTLHKYFHPFSFRLCREFVGEYTNTAAEFDEDEEVRDHMIESCLRDMPYLTKERAVKLVERFGERAETPLDRRIYSDSGFKNILALNVLLMLIQLHYDYGFGTKRMNELLILLERADTSEPLAWLKMAGVELSQNDDSVYRLIDKTFRKDKPISTLREQLDARRQLEALKAYQSEVSSRDKLAGAGTPESP